jgi:hypothetical protein
VIQWKKLGGYEVFTFKSGTRMTNIVKKQESGMPEKIFNINTARREYMARKVLVIVAICVFICSSTALAATLTLPRTGQTASYATGDDGDLKAGVPWPAQRFTSGTGVEVDCITDNLTGLMWAKTSLASANWGSALSTTNSSSLCGHDDWRMPNINELESLVHAGETSTAAWLNSQGFTSLAGAFYWTSTTRMDSLETDQAYVINLGSTGTYEVFFIQKENSHSTLPVRGTTSGTASLWKTGQTLCYDSAGATIACSGTVQDGDIQAGIAWPVTRFEITYCNTSGPCPSQASDCDANTATDIVTDNLTGLVWARNPGTTLNVWQGALTYANDLSLCGYNDWRMPNRKELRSLTNYGTSNGAGYLAGQGFQNVENSYWTSTTSAVTPANAYINYFATAEKVEEWSKTTGGSWRPWAVRAGGASDISLSPGALDFGDVVFSMTSPIQTITITNTGTVDLVISSIEMAGTSPTMFAAVQGATNGCDIPNAIVIPGASCTLDVTFTPAALDLQEALLYINSNDPDTPTQVSLSGNGAQFLYTPLEGTIGTEITILGLEFGDKKGKVLIGTVATKVTSWTNERVIATVKKVPLPVGPYKLSFSTKLATITLPDDFTVKNPELDPLTDDNRGGFPEEEIVLTGKYFGTKKGKVYLDDLSSGKKRSCKVSSWYMNPTTGVSTISFFVPKLSKSFTLGRHPLTIVNKIGFAVASEDFIVGLP